MSSYQKFNAIQGDDNLRTEGARIFVLVHMITQYKELIQYGEGDVNKY